jgi:manganese/zinc/iron transport system permease protein
VLKELKVGSFDPAFADTVGMRPKLIHYLIMALTALTTVAAFEVVGSILVIAMLIIPGATAHLLTDRLRWMIPLAAAVALLASYLGIALSLGTALSNAEPAALVAVSAGALYFLAALFAPRYGIVSTWWHQARQALRILGEDLLAMFYRIEELAPGKHLGTGETAQALGGGLIAWLAIWQLQWRRQIVRTERGWQLTAAGRNAAKRLVRSHRLWEVWLVENLGLPADHVHAPAERMEHYIGKQLEEQLAAELSASERDPHGRAIPQ